MEISGQGGITMPQYISLVRFTQKGIENVKESANRLEAGKKAWAAVGGKILHFYLTMGRYDMVAVSEFPDDATAARANLALGAQGNLRTETMRALTEEEYRKVIASLP
jgi:uncharacterized protein with GYD domain